LISFSKVVEKILHKRLYDFFDQQKIFSKEQHGFRLKTSTETAAFSLLETVLKALNNKNSVGIHILPILTITNFIVS